MCLDVGAGAVAGGFIGEADGEGVWGFRHERAGEGVAAFESDAEEAVARGDGLAGEDEGFEEELGGFGADFSEVGADRAAAGVGGVAADALGGDVVVEEVLADGGVATVEGAGVGDQGEVALVRVVISE